MRKLGVPCLDGIPEAIEIQVLIEKAQSTWEVEYDRLIERIPKDEKGALTAIHHLFGERPTLFDLGLLVSLLHRMKSQVRGTPSVVQSLYEYTTRRLAKAWNDLETLDPIAAWTIARLQDILVGKEAKGQ